MSEVANELVYEILKKIRDDVAHVRQRVDGHDEQFKGLRVGADTLKRRLSLLDG